MTHTRSSRRILLAATLALAAGAAFGQAPAWPTRPVKIVVSFPPGGPIDLVARAAAELLQSRYKQPFIVENKPGAAGNIGADAVAKAAPDGYTLMMGIDTTFTINPHIYKTMPFKPADLKPVMVVASSGLMVVTQPSHGFKKMADLVAAAKSKGVSFSSAGSGAPGHLAAEMASESGMKIQHIPYKGNTPAVTAILGGEVTGGVLASPGLLPFVKSGKLTALAVTSRKRSPLAPDVPTVAEAGMPQLEQEILYLMMAPAGLPEPIVAALQKGLADTFAQPEVRARFEAIDLHYEGIAGPAAAKRLADLSDRYGKVIRATGMKVE